MLEELEIAMALHALCCNAGFELHSLVCYEQSGTAAFGMHVLRQLEQHQGACAAFNSLCFVIC